MKIAQRTGRFALRGKIEAVSSFLPGEKAWADLMTVFQYLKGGYREDGCSNFIRNNMEKTRSKKYKLHQERFYIRKNFFYNENNLSVEKSPWGHSGIPIAGDFQDTIGWGGRLSHLVSLSYERLA